MSHKFEPNWHQKNKILSSVAQFIVKFFGVIIQHSLYEIQIAFENLKHILWHNTSERFLFKTYVLYKTELWPDWGQVM